MKNKLTPRFWCALTLFSLIGQIAWVVENMYLNVFIYKMFNASASDISLMVGASAVAATVTTVLMGALSDKLGKRKLFICSGYILWGVSIFCFALLRTDILGSLFPMVASAASLGVSLTVVLDCVMTFFGSSANDAAFNAWVTDSTDDSNRGAAEGINSMMPLVAILVVFGSFMAFDLEKQQSWSVIFIIIGAIVVAVGILGLFLIKDNSIPKSQSGYFQNVIYGFRPQTVKKNTSLYITLATYIIFNISIQIFMPYLIIYYEVSLGMSDYVLIMAPAIILASVVTAFWGKVYDKKNFKFSGTIAVLWLCIGYIILYFFKTTLPVFIGSLFMMCGYLSGMAVFGAQIRQLTPQGYSGRLQGARIFSQVLIPGVVGPFIGKTVLSNAETIQNNDGTFSFVPNENIFLAALLAAIPVLLAIILSNKKKVRTVALTTPFEEQSKHSWENTHPRPQMKRESFVSLCGEWELSVKHKGSETPLGKVTVPFAPESRISNIERQLGKKEAYIYRKTFSHTANKNERVLLHFGAVDQIAKITLNGSVIGSHTGGYLPFDFDITKNLVTGENTLLVEVADTLDKNFPYGKQRKKRGGMWYTPISGIWQSVWLENVPRTYIRSLKLTPTLDSITIRTEGGADEKSLILEDGTEYRWNGDEYTIQIKDPHHWTPEDPYLYSFTLVSGEDSIRSYFALRTVSIEKVNATPYICLNGKPYFYNGLLDQGYYSDGIYTPASPDGYIYDILTMKKLGFNMLRKHIKLEPDIFYYYCDKYGMIVFQDMVNSGKYRYVRDTVLPTIGMRSGFERAASNKRAEQFERDAKDTVDHLYNHPCVCYYTIFNEGWGQYECARIYKDMKTLDSTRVWDTASGWFRTKHNDVVSEHIYFKKLNIRTDGERPLVLSEFGGYSCKIKEHSFNLDKTFGYRDYATKEEFFKGIEELYLNEVIPNIKNGLCATVLTQLSDVEDETNGLVTYDRRVVKVEQDKMRALCDKVQQAFNQSI